MTELSKLISCVELLGDKHPEALLYLRGDFNVNNTNHKRISLLDHLCHEQDLLSVSIQHPTYHHFQGNGASDSHLDKLLFSRSTIFPEELAAIICKLDNPLVNSHHDILISRWGLPFVFQSPPSSTNISAPRIENSRVKVSWSEDGIVDYEAKVHNSTPHGDPRTMVELFFQVIQNGTSPNN